MTKILIIGSGMSGLTAARELESRGHQVTLVDKGRGIGGRMATRRFDGGTFDHGAQFFTTRTPEFQEAVQQWQAAEVATHWFDGYPSPEDAKPDDHHPRFCGSRGMTGICKHLAEGLDVHLDVEIASLQYDGQQWHVTAKNGQTFEAEKLLLTAPVPQSLALVDTSGVELPAEARDALESLRYEPCFAVLVTLKGKSAIPAPGLFYVNGEPISWIADNYQKGVSPREGSLTIHSSAKFARDHYDQDQTEVGQLLLDAAKEWLGSEVESFQVRRWRYSKPENPIDLGAVAVPELGLAFAGDALMGAKVEGAFLSGLAAARELVK